MADILNESFYERNRILPPYLFPDSLRISKFHVSPALRLLGRNSSLDVLRDFLPYVEGNLLLELDISLLSPKESAPAHLFTLFLNCGLAHHQADCSSHLPPSARLHLQL